MRYIAAKPLGAVLPTTAASVAADCVKAQKAKGAVTVTTWRVAVQSRLETAVLVGKKRPKPLPDLLPTAFLRHVGPVMVVSGVARVLPLTFGRVYWYLPHLVAALPRWLGLWLARLVVLTVATPLVVLVVTKLLQKPVAATLRQVGRKLYTVRGPVVVAALVAHPHKVAPLALVPFKLYKWDPAKAVVKLF